MAVRLLSDGSTSKETPLQQMRMTRSPVISLVATHRTCARCGTNFEALGREYLCSICRKPRPKHRMGGVKLSSRESQIIVLIRQAKTNKQIAYELCLTEGTVKEYLNRIFKKLQVSNRTELALRGLNLQTTAVS